MPTAGLCESLEMGEGGTEEGGDHGCGYHQLGRGGGLRQAAGDEQRLGRERPPACRGGRERLLGSWGETGLQGEAQHGEAEAEREAGALLSRKAKPSSSDVSQRW